MFLIGPWGSLASLDLDTFTFESFLVEADLRFCCDVMGWAPVG